MRSGKGSLRRWHLSKDLQEVRVSALWLSGGKSIVSRGNSECEGLKEERA